MNRPIEKLKWLSLYYKDFGGKLGAVPGVLLGIAACSEFEIEAKAR